MKQLPTAEELLLSKKYVGYPGEVLKTLAPSLMVEYAKLHVQAALESAAEKSMIDAEPESGRIVTRKEFDFDDRGMVCPYNLSVNKELILNAYPLENIK